MDYNGCLVQNEKVGKQETELKADELLTSIVPNCEVDSFSTGILFLLGKDYEFEKDKLIQLWIAGGFIQNEPMEINGANFFEILVSEGYIQRSKSDSMYKVNFAKVNSRFNMFSDKSSYLRLESECQNSIIAAATEILHVSVVDDDMIDSMFETLDKFSKLRTLLFMDTGSSRLEKVLLELFLSFEFLEVLDLSGTDIKELPSSTGKLINLRYLDLSWTFIELLPKAICRFEGLQTLRLKGCSNLWRLPSEMERLAKLRHLDFDILGHLSVMPTRIGSLLNLQTLSAFLIGTEEGRKITELRDLNHLKGEFCIASVTLFKCENVRVLPSMQKLPSLKYLRLISLISVIDLDFRGQLMDPCAAFPKLEELLIEKMLNLETWMESEDRDFPCLVELTIKYCPKLSKLPSPVYLSSILKRLEISSCPKVQFVPEKELSPSLEFLMVEDCPLIEESYSNQDSLFLEKIKHVSNVWIDQDDESELRDDDDHTTNDSDDTE